MCVCLCACGWMWLCGSVDPCCGLYMCIFGCCTVFAISMCFLSVCESSFRYDDDLLTMLYVLFTILVSVLCILMSWYCPVFSTLIIIRQDTIILYQYLARSHFIYVQYFLPLYSAVQFFNMCFSIRLYVALSGYNYMILLLLC